MQAFVPDNISEKMEEKVNVGKIYVISNFTVKDYKPYERFRCVRSERQIIFTDYTNIEEVHDNETLIQENDFDIFDLADLKEEAKQNVYLTGSFLFACNRFTNPIC